MPFDKIKNFSGLNDLSFLGVANIAGSGISAIFWFYLASIMTTEHYGEVSYLISIASIAAVISLTGSSYTIIVYSAKKENIFPAISIISISCSVIVALILLILFDNYVISVYAIGYVIFNVVMAEMLGQKQYRNYSKFFITQKILVVVVAIPLYYFIGPSGIILGFGISFLFYSFLVFRNFRKSKLDFNNLRNRIGFMINGYITDISKVFSANLDKLIIAPLMGYTLLGNYFLGLQFLMVFTILPSIVTQYTLPQDASGSPKKKLKQYTVFITIGISFLGIFLSPYVIPLFFPHYIDAILIIQIFSFAVVPRTISQLFMSKFLGMGKSKIIVIGAGIFLVIQIPSIFILGSIYGINGVAVSLVLAETIQAIFLFLVNHVNNNTQSKLTQEL